MPNPRTRDEYASDSNTAAYWWRAERAGVTVAAEYDSMGIEHSLLTIPGIDVVDGHPILVADELTLHAMPYRAELPPLAQTFTPGERVIWLHRVVMMAAAGNYEGSPMVRFETLLFGTEVVGQRYAPLSIFQVHPTGHITRHPSVADALQTPILL